MTLTTKTPDELQTLLATARESQAAIEAELKRREEEEAEKARKRVRPLAVCGPNHVGDYTVAICGDILYIKDPRTARVHAYAECMAKAAEDCIVDALMPQGYDRIEAIRWCADMITERESAAHRIQAARNAGFID